MVVIKRLSTIAEEKAMSNGAVKKIPRTCKLEKFRKA